MITVERSIPLSASPAPVWPWLVEAERFVRWSPVEAFRWLDTPSGEPLRFELDERMSGRVRTYACTVTELKPCERFAYIADGGFVKVEASYWLELEGEGCRCTIRESVILGEVGASRVLGAMGAGWLLGKAVEGNLRKLVGVVGSA